MTVKELIDELTALDDPTKEVHFQYNYGDHWRTQVAPSITSVEVGGVKHSAYHNMDAVADEEDGPSRNPSTKIRAVVLLS